MWILALAAACRGDAPAPDASVTWHRDLRPIAARACDGCHLADSGVAPFALDPATVADLAPAIAAVVADRTMPPWSFDPACREPVGSLWLPDEDLAAFAAWADQGYPMGDEADYVAPPLPPPFDPGPPDLVFSASEPYRPDASQSDDYRCLVSAEVLAEETYLRGVRTVPQNLEVAHHVILYAVGPAELEALAALEADDPEPGYACFGGPGVDGALTLGGWAPGSDGQFVPEGTAIRVPAGARLVMEMHYNLDGVVGEPGTDQTRAELWALPPGEVPDQVVIAFPIAKVGLQVPPGAEDSEQISRMRVPVTGKILASNPHMHLHGQTLRTDLRRPDGSSVCISDVPAWDFDWQRTYGVPEGSWIPVSMDDEIELRCTYDNPGDAELVWGERTSDEMCLDYLGIVVPWDGGTTGGTCSGYPTCDAACPDDDPFCSLACMTSSGDACLFCGLPAFTSECVGLQCPAQGLGLQVCMSACAQEFEDSLRCLYEDCRAQFDAYWDCTKPIVEAGAPGCEDEFAACPEIAGP
jgi:hypothetical protein